MNKVTLLFIKWIRLSLCLITLSFFVLSCEKGDIEPVENQKTLFMYLPWSTDLTEFFYTNISDMEKAISQHGLNGERVIVFMSTTSEKATLFEITCKKGKCEQVTLKEYNNPPFTTAEGITSILNDVKSFAPAPTYAMTIGCHGMGWLPVHSAQGRARTSMKMHWDYEGVPRTRYFGGRTSQYQTDITTLAEGIAGAGIKMEYILFDDCYMSTIEVAYDLRNVTDYLIGSTCEIMAYGMPYSIIGKDLMGEPNYQAICDGFYSFYSTYEEMPCGTLGITNCAELDHLAAIMKEINNRYTFDISKRNQLQPLDGYYPVIFYDYGDYVAHLCDDTSLLKEFKEQLERAVPYKTHTETYYSMKTGATTPIKTFSGITVSDPSVNSLAADKTETNWYKATH